MLATDRPVPSHRHRSDVVLGAAAAGATAAALALAGAAATPAAATIAAVAAAGAAPALTRIDLAERRLPNAITLPLVAVAAACAGIAAIAGSWAGGAVAVVAIAVLAVMWLAGGMGGGDLKLGAALALALAPFAWWTPLAGLAASFVAGGLVGLVARIRGESSLPFGPWLLVGHGIALAAAVL